MNIERDGLLGFEWMEEVLYSYPRRLSLVEYQYITLCKLKVGRESAHKLDSYRAREGIFPPPLLQRLFFFAGTKAGMQAPHLTIGSIAFTTVPLPPLSALPETHPILFSFYSLVHLH